MRAPTLVESAIGFSLAGSLLFVFVPAFVRDLHASYFTEAVSGLSSMSQSALARHAQDGAFPSSAPLTPATPPRGGERYDPPGTWDHPSWVALAFRPSPEGVAHAFSFAFDHEARGFVAHAHGDLDGDGTFSTFELRGTDVGEAKLLPGMYVEAELE